MEIAVNIEDGFVAVDCLADQLNEPLPRIEGLSVNLLLLHHHFLQYFGGASEGLLSRGLQHGVPSEHFVHHLLLCRRGISGLLGCLGEQIASLVGAKIDLLTDHIFLGFEGS